MASVTEIDRSILPKVEALGESLQAVRGAVGGIILGQEAVVDAALVTLLAGGHALLIGVPGLAKTRLVETLGAVLGLDERRVQFTPDLMPADILGSEVLEESETGRRSFRFVPGPVFCQLLMADEVNRASPRTQSALLQAMQERQVSIAGHRHALPEPFHVLATQNPLEQEGTYPLPEAQLDRFLLQIDVAYPDVEAERQILLATTGAEPSTPKAIMTAEDLLETQRLLRQIPVGTQVVDAILDIVRRLRPAQTDSRAVQRYVSWGPGPRGAQSLMLGVRARALLDGRLAPSVDDVLALVKPALRHRMALNFEAMSDGMTIDAIIDEVTVPHA